MVDVIDFVAYKESSAKEIVMTDLTPNMFVHKIDRDTVDEALVASRIKAAAVVTSLQTNGTHWTLSAKPAK